MRVEASGGALNKTYRRFGFAGNPEEVAVWVPRLDFAPKQTVTTIWKAILVVVHLNFRHPLLVGGGRVHFPGLSTSPKKRQLQKDRRQGVKRLTLG